MKKVTVIPLDSRPCNTSWMEKFARNANLELSIYPKDECGNLLVGANLDKMIEFLDKEIPTTDYLIISADGLCSGGLVQARLGKINLDEVLMKVEVLKKYKLNNPNLKIYLFDTIMRTSITAYNQESERYWGKMNEYSKLVGRCYFFNNEEDKLRLQELEKEIPNQIISTYKNARNIKHELNKYFINLVHDQVIDYMILLQEDSMPYGVQKIEQIKLIELINELKVNDYVKFYNGTDEGGVILLGKIIIKELGKSPKIYVHLLSEDSLNRVMPFEDQPFQSNLDKMFETISFTKTQDYNEADFILGIYTEKSDYNLNLHTTNEIKPLKDNNYHKFIGELNNFINLGKKVAFVDLLFPNGGSIDLLNDINFEKLSVYSAWNTASNSLGSCLCDIACHMVNNKVSSKFLYERILDDCIYQYIVRRIINQKYISLGFNIYNLEEKANEVLEDIRKLMNEYNILPFVKFKIDLPWKRTFEIDINVED